MRKQLSINDKDKNDRLSIIKLTTICFILVSKNFAIVLILSSYISNKLVSTI